MSPAERPRRVGFGLLLWLLACLNGCALIPGLASYAVFFDVDLEVASAPGAAESSTRAAPQRVTHSADADSVNSLGNPVFHGRDFSAGFTVSKTSLGIQIAATSSREVCFRLDQATLTSRFASASIAFGKMPPRLSDDMTRQMTVRDYQDHDTRWRAATREPVTRLCLGPGEQVRIHSLSEMREYFPSGQMFNINHPQHASRLDADGAGERLTILLPVETADGRDQMAFTLIARKARTSEIQF